MFNHSLHTYVTEEVDEGVVAGVGHGEPVAAEPDDVDVRIAKKHSGMCYLQQDLDNLRSLLISATSHLQAVLLLDSSDPL